MKALNASVLAAALFMIVGVVSFTRSGHVADLLLWAAIGLALLAAGAGAQGSSKPSGRTPKARELGAAAGLVSVILFVTLAVTTRTPYPLLGAVLGLALLAASVRGIAKR